MINEDILEKVDTINMRLNWLEGVSELMRSTDHNTGTGRVLVNVGSLIKNLTADIKKDVSSIWESSKGNVEKGGVKNG
jgi:hypothetical protein